jgi:hypothetical protein
LLHRIAPFVMSNIIITILCASAIAFAIAERERLRRSAVLLRGIFVSNILLRIADR